MPAPAPVLALLIAPLVTRPAAAASLVRRSVRFACAAFWAATTSSEPWSCRKRRWISQSWAYPQIRCRSCAMARAPVSSAGACTQSKPSSSDHETANSVQSKFLFRLPGWVWLGWRRHDATGRGVVRRRDRVSSRALSPPAARISYNAPNLEGGELGSSAGHSPNCSVNRLAKKKSLVISSTCT